MSSPTTTTAALASRMIREHYLTSGVTADVSRYFLLCAKLIGQRTGQTSCEVMDEAVALANAQLD